MKKSVVKRWSIIFKLLGNENRIKILNLLKDGKQLSVGTIAEKLKISVYSASKHLIILQRLNILDSLGKEGRVLYSISKEVPKDFKKIMNQIF